MTDIRLTPAESDTRATTATPAAAPAPMFRRYQIKIKTGVRVGAVPTGHPPTGF